MFYDILGEEEENEKYLLLAKQLAGTNGEDSVFMAAAKFLVATYAGQLTERAISEDMLNAGPRIAPFLILAQLEQQRGNYELALENIQEALKIKQDDPNVWSALGFLYYAQHQWDKAQNAYETVLTLTQIPQNMPTVHTRLGTIYLHHITAKTPRYDTPDLKIYLAKQAKTMFMRSCEAMPTSHSWLGTGKACIVLEELQEAEDALSEANVLNNRNGQVWASLAHLCLLQGRQYEANQSISQALSLGIRDIDTLRSVGKCFLDIGELAQASNCLELALELLYNHQEDLKKRQRAIYDGKELQKRQKQKQYEIENYIYLTKKEEDMTAELPDNPDNNNVTFEEDSSIKLGIVEVKELLSKALYEEGHVRQINV